MIDGIVGPWFLEPYRRAARASGVALHYVVLRPSDPVVSIARVQNRTEQGLKDAAVIRDVYRQFSNLGPLERHALDAAGQTPEQTATLIDAQWRSGRVRLPD